MNASSKKGGIPKGHSKTARPIRLDNYNVIKKQNNSEYNSHKTKGRATLTPPKSREWTFIKKIHAYYLLYLNISLLKATH